MPCLRSFSPSGLASPSCYPSAWSSQHRSGESCSVPVGVSHLVVGGIRVCEGLAWDLGGPGIGAGLVFPSSNALRAGVHYECDFFFFKLPSAAA